MDWIKRWHTVKFIVLVYDGSRGVGASVWINTLTLTLSLSVSLSSSLSEQEIISGSDYSQSILFLVQWASKF